LIDGDAAKSKSSIGFAESDAQILLYRPWDRFKSIFLPDYVEPLSSAQRSEHFFAGAAYRTFPVIRQIFKLGSFGDFPLAVPSIRVINISAVNRLALKHFMRLGHLPSLKSPSKKLKSKLNHENTKWLKHEILFFPFRVFSLSCFRGK
jgi:hypothetical protein